jgi:hypothetical protein
MLVQYCQARNRLPLRLPPSSVNTPLFLLNFSLPLYLLRGKSKLYVAKPKSK